MYYYLDYIFRNKCKKAYLIGILDYNSDHRMNPNFIVLNNEYDLIFFRKHLLSLILLLITFRGPLHNTNMKVANPKVVINVIISKVKEDRVV